MRGSGWRQDRPLTSFPKHPQPLVLSPRPTDWEQLGHRLCARQHWAKAASSPPDSAGPERGLTSGCSAQVTPA